MKTVNTPLLLGALALVWSAQHVLATARPPATGSADPLIRDYRSWTRVTPKAVWVAGPLAADCAAAAPLGSVGTSPHLDKFINVYVNRLGAPPMLRRRQPRFPVGTIIVKEKRAAAKDTVPELFTVMEKMPASFDPKHGDWQYSVFDGQGKRVATDSVKHCQSCHQRVAQGDYVFRDYLSKAQRSVMR